MSHVATVEIRIKWVDDLRAVCEELGLTYDEAATAWRWWGRWVNDWHEANAAYHHGVKPEEYGTADAGVIRVPGASWDIGVYRRGGEYVLVYDNYGGSRGLEKALGAGLTKLKAAYTERVARRRLRKLGMSVRKRIDASGRIVLTGVR